MATKNIYLFKAIIHDTQNNEEVPVTAFRHLFLRIFDAQCTNNALPLTYMDSEPMVLDIIDNTDDYLFARLNRKRLNNSIQKRNYNTYETSDVLAPDELGSNGVELFTYCIFGYKHGILSIVNSKGAPTEGALSRIFALYNHRYSLELEAIPNSDLINELLAGRMPEINRVRIDIAQPNAEILQDLFGFRDDEVIQTLATNASGLVFEIKPSLRGALSTDVGIITRLIQVLKNNRANYNSVVISGKADSGDRQRQYDLYEEYFKYPINVAEYHQQDGRKVEVSKDIIQQNYRDQMMQVYDEYKMVIIAMSGR